MRRVTRWLVGLTAAGLAAAAAWLTLPAVDAARSLITVTGQPPWAVPYAASADRVTHDDIEIPTRHGPIAARIYRPAQPTTLAVVVVPGIHSGGVDQPRLAELSSRLAATGANVVSVPLPDLRQYVVTPASTDQIEDAVLWASAQPAIAPSGRVGLIGVSFGGGLAVVAAGRQSLEGLLTSVLSIGGHADLPRVMAFLSSGRPSSDDEAAPNAYGVAVILLGAADRLVPVEQAGALRRVVRTHLDAAGTMSVDLERAQALADEAARLASDLPSPAAELAGLALSGNVDALGARLLPYVEALGGAPALSPERSPPPTAPVFLLHGDMDDLIPAGESRSLDEDLRARGAPLVRTLVTPLLRHTDVRPDATAGAAWDLVRFWIALRSAG